MSEKQRVERWDDLMVVVKVESKVEKMVVELAESKAG